ncbi:hypothetical protein [Kineococcus sp. R86509]|uniref:hypothetical protein n=1 Tax=Kineococcus sp. R86509 TaxID=3093851 RepID=UPI0036D2CD14
MDGLAAAAGVLPVFVIVGLVVWLTTRAAERSARWCALVRGGLRWSAECPPWCSSDRPWPVAGSVAALLIGEEFLRGGTQPATTCRGRSSPRGDVRDVEVGPRRGLDLQAARPRGPGGLPAVQAQERPGAGPQDDGVLHEVQGDHPPADPFVRSTAEVVVGLDEVGPRRRRGRWPRHSTRAPSR